MKNLLLLLLFFSIDLCAVQEASSEEAFQANSDSDKNSPRELTSMEFISRVREIKNETLVTEQDFKMLLKLDFEPITRQFSSEWSHCTDQKKKEKTWSQITSFVEPFVDRADENGNPIEIENGKFFADFLSFFYHFESFDSLSREQFWNFYNLLDYLTSGKQMKIIDILKALDEMYGTILRNSDLKNFAHKDEEFRKVLISILTPTTLSVDLDLLNSRFIEDITPIVEDILESLAKDFQSSGFSKLEKIVFKPSISNEKMQNNFLQILKKNAESLTSLEIKAYEFDSPAEILFPNVQKLSLNISKLKKFKLKFLQHSNYTTLNLGHNVAFTKIDGKEYFWILPATGKLTALMSLIKQNENLETLVWDFYTAKYGYSAINNVLKSLNSTLKSLKKLTSFKFIENNIHFPKNFEPPLTIQSLSIDFFRTFDWKFLKGQFPNLEHFSIQNMSFSNLGKYLEFVRATQLRSISLILDDYQKSMSNSETNPLSDLCKENTLEKIDLKFLSKEIPTFELHEKFQAIDFYYEFSSTFESKISSLPSGPGVKYLRIQIPFWLKNAFTFKYFADLKKKFPKLEFLILPFGSTVDVGQKPVGLKFK